MATKGFVFSFLSGDYDCRYTLCSASKLIALMKDNPRSVLSVDKGVWKTVYPTTEVDEGAKHSSLEGPEEAEAIREDAKALSNYKSLVFYALESFLGLSQEPKSRAFVRRGDKIKHSSLTAPWFRHAHPVLLRSLSDMGMACLAKALDEAVKKEYGRNAEALKRMDVEALASLVGALSREEVPVEVRCQGKERCVCFVVPAVQKTSAIPSSSSSQPKLMGPNPLPSSSSSSLSLPSSTAARNGKKKLKTAKDFNRVDDFRCYCPMREEDGQMQPPPAKRGVMNNPAKKWLMGKAYFACAKWMNDPTKCGCWELEDDVVAGRNKRPPICPTHAVNCEKKTVTRPGSPNEGKEIYACPFWSNEEDPCSYGEPVPEPVAAPKRPYPSSGFDRGPAPFYKKPWNG